MTADSRMQESVFAFLTDPAQGRSVLVDAVFADEAERNAIRDAARKLNVRFAGLFLVTDLATRLSRVGRRVRYNVSDAKPEIAGLQEKYNIGEVNWAIIDASGTSEQTVKQWQTRIANVRRLNRQITQDSNAAIPEIRT
jgi:hypothetical protein